MNATDELEITKIRELLKKCQDIPAQYTASQAVQWLITQKKKVEDLLSEQQVSDPLENGR